MAIGGPAHRKLKIAAHPSAAKTQTQLIEHPATEFDQP
jgi:hypothetical protein